MFQSKVFTLESKYLILRDGYFKKTVLSEMAGYFGVGLSEGVGKESLSSFYIFISQASVLSCLLSFGLGKLSMFLWVFLEEWKNESEAWLSVYATPELAVQHMDSVVAWMLPLTDHGEQTPNSYEALM